MDDHGSVWTNVWHTPPQGSVKSAMPTTKPTAVVLPKHASVEGLAPPPSTTVVTTPRATFMHPVAVVHPMSHSSNQQENIDISGAFAPGIDKREAWRDRTSTVYYRATMPTGQSLPGSETENLSPSLAEQRNAHNKAMEIYFPGGKSRQRMYIMGCYTNADI